MNVGGPLDDTVLTFGSAAVVLSLHSKPTAINAMSTTVKQPVRFLDQKETFPFNMGKLLSEVKPCNKA